MPHALRVRGLQRVANAGNDGQRLLRREAACTHRLAEIHAIDELHQQVEEAAAFATFENRDNVRVVQFSKHARLAGEALCKRRVAAEFGRQDLQRHGAIERGLPHFIHKAHAALPDEREHFELRESRPHFFERRRSAASRREFIRIAQDARRTEPARRMSRDGSFASRTEFRVHTGS